MGVLEDLETNLNGAVVELQNKVAELIASAKAVTPAPAESDAQVEADIAKVEADEAVLDADTATLDSDQKAEEAPADVPVTPSEPTQIPVTDGTEVETTGEDASTETPADAAAEPETTTV